MDKIKIVLDLVRKELINDEQAEILLITEKEYVYSYPVPYSYVPWTYAPPVYYPYLTPTITYCSSGSGSLTLTSGSTATGYSCNNNTSNAPLTSGLATFTGSQAHEG